MKDMGGFLGFLLGGFLCNVLGSLTSSGAGSVTVDIGLQPASMSVEIAADASGKLIVRHATPAELCRAC